MPSGQIVMVVGRTLFGTELVRGVRVRVRMFQRTVPMNVRVMLVLMMAVAVKMRGGKHAANSCDRRDQAHDVRMILHENILVLERRRGNLIPIPVVWWAHPTEITWKKQRNALHPA